MVNNIIFNEEKHIYTVDGREYPSVTTILQEIGLNDLSNIKPEILENAQRFGIAFHKLIELYIKTKDITAIKCDPLLLPYFSQFLIFCNEYDFKVEYSELKMVDKSLGFAGCVDLIGKVNGILSLIDLKTSSSILPHYYIQMGGYKILSIANGIPVVNRYILKLEKEKYILELCKKEVYDKSLFISALNLWQYRKLNHKYFESQNGYIYEL